MDFYTEVTPYRNQLLVSGYKNGKKILKRVDYQPYMFVGTQDKTEYQDIKGNYAGKINFESIREAKDFIKNYSDVNGMNIYGLSNFQYTYIYDLWPGDVPYDVSQISVGSIDLECSIANGLGFPDIQEAENPITLITISKNGHKYTFGCRPFSTDRKDVTYTLCTDEVDLLRKFLTKWGQLDFDVITGWNIETFDIPYVINRMMKLLGEKETKKLSPWGLLLESKIEVMDKTMQVYFPVGITVLDYLPLYKKFSFTPQEQYSLDYISQQELGVGKLEAAGGRHNILYFPDGAGSIQVDSKLPDSELEEFEKLCRVRDRLLAEKKLRALAI